MKDAEGPGAVAHVAVTRHADRTILSFDGRLDAAAAGLLWPITMRAAASAHGITLVLDLRAVAACDVAGAAWLAAIEAAHEGPNQTVGPPERVQALVQRARLAHAHAATRPAAEPAGLRNLGSRALAHAVGAFAFLGEAAFALIRLPRRRRMVRAVDLLRFVEQAGIHSIPLVVLLGYLIGLILAFQSAVPMRRFGADIYVASLVAVALLRELGPLLAAVLVMPVMTLGLDVAGLLGMTTVMRGFGFPMVTIVRQVQLFVTPSDLLGGLVKAVCFGAAVAAVGCRAGLATGIGPRAVGQSATAAVVGGIVVTIALDGVFALVFYRLRL